MVGTLSKVKFYTCRRPTAVRKTVLLHFYPERFFSVHMKIPLETLFEKQNSGISFPTRVVTKFLKENIYVNNIVF